MKKLVLFVAVAMAISFSACKKNAEANADGKECCEGTEQCDHKHGEGECDHKHAAEEVKDAVVEGTEEVKDAVVEGAEEVKEEVKEVVE